MQKNRWSRKFEWIKSGSTYIQQVRSEQYDQNRYIAVSDIYFKLNKYLTGVTFSYINNLNDVYKKDLMTGDGYSIVNMYNEYDVIDRAMKNIVFVDVAADINITLMSGSTRTQWKTINNVKLKPGHLVLLKNQNSEFENDIYKVTNQYFLDNAGLISTREKSDKFSCSIKLGNNKDKQFFLQNNGNEFPITYEPKYFIEGQSYILKNLIQYKLDNTSTGNTSKIIFTDYELARKQQVNNYDLYYDAYLDNLNPNFIPNNYVTINYHHDSYTIRSGETINSVEFDGVASGITNNSYKYITSSKSNIDIPTSHPTLVYFTGATNLSYSLGQEVNVTYDTGNTFTGTIINYNILTGEFIISSTNNYGIGSYQSWKIDLTRTPDNGTSIYFPTGFECRIGDYINLNIYSGTGITLTSLLELNTYIKDIQGNSLILEETIPNKYLIELKNYSFFLQNLNVAYNWNDTFDKLSVTPYSNYYDMTVNTTAIPDYILLIFKPKEFIYNKYFDYDALFFDFLDESIVVKFNTDNQYINYKLYDRLHDINNIFNSGFSFFNNYLLNNINYCTYIDNNKVKIVTTQSGITNIFKPYTYVYMSGVGQVTTKTLIYEVHDQELIIEKPIGWDNYPILPQITSVQNIDGLKNISDILYDVYINDEYDWYIRKRDNERKFISRSYGELLTSNEDFRKNVTGILYENQNNEYILKLYDLGRTLSPSGDTNLNFSTVELVFIGADRKSRLPVPLKMMEENSGETYTLYWDYLDSGLSNVLNGSNVFDSGSNVVLPGINFSNPLYNVINGNLDIINTTTTTTTYCIIDFDTYTCIVNFDILF